MPGDVAALDDPTARELLESDLLARLAYAGGDGLPRVVPVAFLWKDSRIVVCTATTAPKVSALQRRPDVAVTIDTGGPPARALFVRGRADIDVVEGVADEYLEAAAKSMSGPDLEAFAAQCRAVYPAMARIAVTPAWARVFDFGAGRLPGFLQELVDSSN